MHYAIHAAPSPWPSPAASIPRTACPVSPRQGWAVHTVYVNTGGATPEERAAIRPQAARRRRGRASRESTRATRSSIASSAFSSRAMCCAARSIRCRVAAERTQQAHLGHRGGARASAPGRWRTAPPAPATTRSASTSRSGCSPPSSRSSRRSATRHLTRDQAIAYLEAREPAGAGQGRRVQHQSRALGHHLGWRLDPRHLGRSAGRAARSARRRARARARS